MRASSLQTSSRFVRYSEAGVDIDAADTLIDAIKPIVRSTTRPGADAEIGGFGAVFDLKRAGYVDPLLVAANDGVGTKVKIAVDTGIHDTIGIDLVAMCVNDLVVQGAEPLFFLDYFAAGHLDPAVGVSVISGIAHGCTIAGAALIGGETAAMPGIYARTDYDLAGFVVGAVERHKLLPRNDTASGDVLLGLSSSGLHSNGFSLVRHVVQSARLEWNDPAPFAKNKTLGAALLEPTRIYVKSVLEALKRSSSIKALAHITGGGLPDNIPRILPESLRAHVDLSTLPFGGVFKWLQKAGPIDEAEMLRTFNCGIGMVVVADKENAGEVVQVFSDLGEEVVEIGEILPRGGDSSFSTVGALAAT